jgi:glycosyltransferase involved in cell wall biosynthesis
VRLLLSSYFYLPSVGGVERQSHLLARGLVGRGHSVRVIAALQPGFAAEETLDGVRIERVSAGEGSRYRRMATYLAAMTAAVFRHRGEADVVQVQQALYPAAALALASPALRRPLVVSNRGSGRDGAVQLMRRLPLGDASLRLIGARATCIALTSEMVSEMSEAGMNRIVVIPNGVEVPPLPTPAQRAEARRGFGLSGPVVVFVGRLEAQKNVALLLAAWARAAPAATLLVVGDGPERPALERLGTASVRFCGAVEDARPHLRAADVFVLPSRSEGIPNALLEAMAHGVASIGTAVAGTQRILDRPGLGLLVTSEDEAALAGALLRLLGDRGERSAIGLAGREHVARHFSVEAMLDAHEQLYRGLLP